MQIAKVRLRISDTGRRSGEEKSKSCNLITQHHECTSKTRAASIRTIGAFPSKIWRLKAFERF